MSSQDTSAGPGRERGIGWGVHARNGATGVKLGAVRGFRMWYEKGTFDVRKGKCKTLAAVKPDC